MRYLTNNSTDPQWNMAFDERVLTGLTSPEPVFYLWQNAPAVIIGRNQSAPAEVNLPYLEEHGIMLARRVTGGGAVYHDLGNLNYSFAGGIREMEALQPVRLMAAALRSMGIPVEVSGRNDLMVEGRKCSGYAKRLAGTRMMIHGTLMWNVDLAALSAALSVPGSKFDMSFHGPSSAGGSAPSFHGLSVESSSVISSEVEKSLSSAGGSAPSFHGLSVESSAVASVRSKVANLSEYLPGLTLSDFRARLHDFLAAYTFPSTDAASPAGDCAPSFHGLSSACGSAPSFHGLSVESLSPAFRASVTALADSKFRTWEWVHGHSPATDFSAARRFPTCGTVRVHFSVRRGLLADVAFSGDFLGALSLDTPLPASLCPAPFGGQTLPEALDGTRYEPASLSALLSQLPIASYFDGLTASELASLLLGDTE